MSRPCLWLLPVFGSLYFLPLRGDEDVNDLTKILDPTQETPITDFLGRADLLDPGSPASKLIEEPKLPLPLIPISPELPEKAPPTEASAEPETNPVLPPAETEPTALEASNAGTGPGELQGVIFDPDGNGIPGVIITFPELGGLQLRTDEKGEFRVTGLPTDGVKAELLRPAYTTKLEVFQIKAEGVTKARVGMELKPIELADGEYLLEDREVILDYEEEEFGGISLGESENPSFVSGIGQEEFSKLGVSDAAGAVGKIAGANIVGGRFAVVRGLGDRYSNTLFNGSLISSADPSRKAVQLDLFPSELLQSLEIQKNYSPDVTAEWAGGLVKIRTLAIPTERLLKVKIGTGIDDQLQDSDNFLQVPGSSFGFLRGSKRTVLDNDFGISYNNRPRLLRQQELNQSFSFTPIQGSREQELDFGITYSDVFKLSKEMRLGIGLSFTREREDAATLNETVNREFSPAAELFSVASDRDTFEQNLNWGLLGAANLEINDRHTIGVNFFRFSDTTSSVQLVTGIAAEQRNGLGGITREELFASSNPLSAGGDGFFFGDAALITQSESTLQTLLRDLQVTQASGSHLFGRDPERGASLSWSAAQSNAEEVRPQDTSLSFTQVDFTDRSILGRTFNGPNGIEEESFAPERGTFGTLGIEGGNQGNPVVLGTRESLSTKEKTSSVDIDFAIPFYFDDESDDRFEIRLGTSLLSKRRETRGELFQLTSTDRLNTAFVTANGGLIGRQFFEGINGVTSSSGAPLFSNSPRAPFSLSLERLTNNPVTRRNIDAATEINSYYILGQYKRNQWDILGGVRFENETRSFEIVRPGILNFNDLTQQNSGSQSNLHIAPSLTVTRTFGDDNQHKFVAAWSETIARPTFFEFAPVFTEDQATGDLRAGNSNLIDSTVMNFDLGWEWNFEETGNFFRLNLFRKEISDTIVNSFLNQGTDEGRAIQTFINAGDGLLQGVELEGSLKLSDQWSLQGNYSYIDSELSVPFGTTGSTEVGFQGQPEHIANLSLSYDREDLGFSANLIYNFTGEFLSIVPESPTSDTVNTKARQSLDVVLQQKLNVIGTDGKVSFRVRNLLDEPITDVLRPSGRIRQSHNPGQSYSLSYSASF